MQGKDSRMGSALKLGDSCALTDAFLDFAQSSEVSFVRMADTLDIQVSTTMVRPTTSVFVLIDVVVRSPRKSLHLIVQKRDFAESKLSQMEDFRF